MGCYNIVITARSSWQVVSGRAEVRRRAPVGRREPGCARCGSPPQDAPTGSVTYAARPRAVCYNIVITSLPAARVGRRDVFRKTSDHDTSISGRRRTHGLGALAPGAPPVKFTWGQCTLRIVELSGNWRSVGMWQKATRCEGRDGKRRALRGKKGDIRAKKCATSRHPGEINAKESEEKGRDTAASLLSLGGGPPEKSPRGAAKSFDSAPAGA